VSRRARCLFALAGVLGSFAIFPAVVSAHPLGNFTVNHYSGIDVAGQQIRVHYVLDLAEIPAFQEKQRIDRTPGYLAGKVALLAQNLSLSVDGSAERLQPSGRTMQFLPGQGGLQTLRIEALFTAGITTDGRHDAAYRDGNDPERIGWREITVRASDGAQVTSSDAPTTSVTNELRTYPQDMLSSPLDTQQAAFSFRRGRLAAGAATLGPFGGGFSGVQDRFAALIAPDNASWSFVFFAIIAAIGLGAAHALGPGHGKAVVAGYMVGSRRGWRSAVLLGGTITATHTAGVFALGLITLYASSLITPERLYPWLTLVSGLLVLLMGGWLVAARSRTFLDGYNHDHAHDHAEHGHHHAADQRRPLRRRGVVLLGVTGGLLPCPSALIVLLAAISLHRVAFGLLLIVAFSTGLALVLVGIGIAVTRGTALIKRIPTRRRLLTAVRAARLLPVVSALVVCVAGVGLFMQALPAIR